MRETDLMPMRDGLGRSLEEAQAEDCAWRRPFARLARWQYRTGGLAVRAADLIRCLSTGYVCLLGITAFHLGLNWGPGALFSCLGRFWPLWLLGILVCALLERMAAALRKAAVQSGHLT